MNISESESGKWNKQCVNRADSQCDSTSLILTLDFFSRGEKKTSFPLPDSTARSLNSSRCPGEREANTLTLWCRPLAKRGTRQQTSDK